MATNRVQFQRGLSMSEFFERYGTEDKCRRALEAARWPRGFGCASCGGAARSVFERGGMRYWQCAACPHQTSLISGTIFQGTKLALRVWFQAMQLLTQSKNNVSALELRRQLGVNYHSAWLLKHKIMQAMHLAEDDRELDGRVEIDDAYLGGERSGGKRGRGSENKVPFIAAVQTTPSGKPIVACLRAQPHTIEQVGAFAATHIAPTATVISDGLWCFRATALVGAEHQRVVTGGGKASVERPEFKAINTLLGNLKTAITGTYHAFDFTKYAHRYLAEFQFRFNRRFNMRTIFHRLLRSMLHAPPTPEPAIRAAEACT